MSVSSAIEIERKYAVTDGVALPALDGVDGVVTAEPRPVVLLEAVYLDTEERTLLAAGIVLRRRTGGHDAGWHIKLRAQVGRTELHAPIDERDPDLLPPEFAAALKTRVRHRALTPIARIRTERTAVVVSDAAGGTVEVVDDVVSATDVAAGVLRSWREWEAEQADDCDACRSLLERVDEVLRAAGASTSESPAKIAQALGLVGGRPPEAVPDTAGAVLAARVAVQTEQLHAGIQSVVLEADSIAPAVRALRRTLRRLRSLLALEGVAGPAGQDLRLRLTTVGRALGDARDPLIAARIAGRLLDRLPLGTPGLEEARALLVDTPLRHLESVVAALAARLGTEEVLELLADLETFVPDGPDVAADPTVLVALAQHQVDRARRRGRRAADGDPAALDAARKAAKRMRSVLEELVEAGVLPPDAKPARSIRRAERVHDVLDEHRDLALVLDGLPAASERLTASGGNAYALGVVAEQGRARATELRRTAEQALRRLP